MSANPSKLDLEFKSSDRSESAEILSELVNPKDFATKTRIPKPFAQACFELLGFDMLSDTQKVKILADAYNRPHDSPITIGDYFAFFSYSFKINEISEYPGKSREEYVSAAIGRATAEQAAKSAISKGLGV